MNGSGQGGGGRRAVARQPTTTQHRAIQTSQMSQDIAERFLKTSKETSSAYCHGTGALAAHGWSRLMLLGSPPDMVHGYPSRKTDSAAVYGGHLPVFYYKRRKDAIENF